MDVAALLSVAIPLAIGIVLTVVGWRTLRPALGLLRTDPVSVLEAANESGPVEVHGTATAGERTLQAPVTGTPCLAYECTLQRERQGQHGSYWSTEYELDDAVPFLVDDGQSMLVYPASARIELDRLESVTVEPGEQLPPGLTSYLEAAGGTLQSDESWRFRERRLDPGDDVVVFADVRSGTSAETAGASFTSVLGPGEAVPTMIVSTSSTLQTGLRMVLAPAVLLLGGCLALLATVWLLSILLV